MSPREPMNDEQKRLLRVTGLMPLASVSNLAPVLGMAERRVRRMLLSLRTGDWVESVRWGMAEGQRRRWFLTRRAVDLLYAADHQHPSPREEARVAAMAQSGQGPAATAEFRARFALDHKHLVHVDGLATSPFLGDAPSPLPEERERTDHEHPPWTATERGVETSLRRLAILEPVYRLAPDLLTSGRARWPNDGAGRDLRMTDFRLLRHGGFYHAVARYGVEAWAPFIYAGVHATERTLRRKLEHRFWGVNCYSHEEDRYIHIGNRVFYEDPDLEVAPSFQVVVAADAWAAGLARRTLTGSTPTVVCTADGHCSEAVELQPSRDLVADPPGHPTVGWPERVGRWLGGHPDVAVIDGKAAYRLFATIMEFPAMRASWLRQLVGGTMVEVNRRLGEFLQAGLVAAYDRRYYLDELGIRRAANLSRVLPAVVRNRHAAYLSLWYREHERLHNDGVNRLVVAFAREGVRVVAGWRGEVNVPNVTQVRPDLLVQVAEGPLGSGTYCIEFERSAVYAWDVNRKLGPYRRMAQLGRPLPLLVVCETDRAEQNFQAAADGLPLLTTTVERALAGPLTGAETAWRDAAGPAELRCRPGPGETAPPAQQ